MVRALMEGRKTQTRRAAKLPHQNPLGIWEPSTLGGRGVYDHRGQPFPEQACIWHTRTGTSIVCPHGTAGDELWVRETFSLESDVDGNPPPFDDGRPIKRAAAGDEGPSWWQPHYRATDPAPFLCCENARCRQCERDDAGPHWRPSIFMPRWVSRITLKTTDVRCERLQDISEADAKAEGAAFVCEQCGNDLDTQEGSEVHSGCDDPDCTQASHKNGYRQLWNRINGKNSWSINPFVWALTFEVIK